MKIFSRSAGQWVVGALAASLLCACGSDAPKITDCKEKGGLIPICGIQNPEDMAVLPGGRFVIAGQYGGIAGEKPKGFALYDSASGAITQLGPFAENSPELWGSPDCKQPPGPAFSAHGIELAQRNDGRWQLLAVNHGGRESLEWFEVTIRPSDPAPVNVTWRGCAEAPEGAVLNAVATLPNGAGQLTSQIWKHKGPATPIFAAWNMVASRFGWGSGAVLHWDGKTYSEVPGISGYFPNGIVVSADGRFMYVNNVGLKEIQKYAISGGKPLASVGVNGYPDNVRWSADRKHLFVASQRGSLSDTGDCMKLESGACGMRAAIVMIDPETMTAQELFEHEGAPMGGFTVAVELKDSLLLGAFASDRILLVPKTKLLHPTAEAKQ